MRRVDDRLASDPDSLLAKTLDLKDHVVAGARHAVSAIGDVFASVGERIGAAGFDRGNSAPNRAWSGKVSLR